MIWSLPILAVWRTFCGKLCATFQNWLDMAWQLRVSGVCLEYAVQKKQSISCILRPAFFSPPLLPPYTTIETLFNVVHSSQRGRVLEEGFFQSCPLPNISYSNRYDKRPSTCARWYACCSCQLDSVQSQKTRRTASYLSQRSQARGRPIAWVQKRLLLVEQPIIAQRIADSGRSGSRENKCYRPIWHHFCRPGREGQRRQRSCRIARYPSRRRKHDPLYQHGHRQGKSNRSTARHSGHDAAERRLVLHRSWRVEIRFQRSSMGYLDHLRRRSRLSTTVLGWGRWLVGAHSGVL